MDNPNYLVLNNTRFKCQSSKPSSPYLVVNNVFYLPLTTTITTNNTLKGDDGVTYQIVENTNNT